MGAKAVNNLASKLLLALFPPNAPFFKQTVPDQILNEIAEKAGKPGIKPELEAQLASEDRAIQKFIESSALRSPAYICFKQLIITGNSCLHIDTDGKGKVYRIDNYVVERDPEGVPLEIIVREGVDKRTLSEAQLAVLPENIEDDGDSFYGGLDSKENRLVMYTRITRDSSNKWQWFQEINETIMPDTEGSCALDVCPWIPLTWTLESGHNYGIGHVEEQGGDMKAFDSYSKYMLEGAAAMAKLLFLLNPNGMTKFNDVATAPNGATIVGRKEDIEALQIDKFADFRFVEEKLQKLEKSISEAFLLHTSVRRDAERVTAEEIRYMAQELETVLGGIYTTLAQSFQMKVFLKIRDVMGKKRLLKPKNPYITPVITTGLEALGRGQELVKLRGLIEDITAVNPQLVPQYFRVDALIKKFGTARGLDTEDIIKTREELEAEALNARQQAITDGLVPGIAVEAAKGMIPQNDNG